MTQHEEPLPTSLQQSILTTLLVNNRYGALIAAQIQPGAFDDGLYREVATAVLDYRRRYNRAPGWSHTDDLFSAQLADSHRRGPLLRKLLGDLLALSEGLNAEYIASQTQQFLKEQGVKTMLSAVEERYSRGGPEATDDILDIIRKGLKSEPGQLDAGTFLTDSNRALSFLDTRTIGLPLGIPGLDKLGIGPTPKELLLYIAPKSSGKSWFCVHVGKQGLLHKERIVHISLEFAEDRIAGRYFQSLFAGGWEPAVQVPRLELGESDQFVSFTTERQKVAIDFSLPDARKLLTAKIADWGIRLGRLVIKQFPTGGLTLAQLEGYLDYIEATHKFIPTILIIDYPDLMKLDPNNYRISLGRVFEDLRGLGVKRNLAIVVPTQSNRESIGARQNTSKSVAEDIRKINTADNVLVYSQTNAEYELGLARLSLDHARNNRDRSQYLIAQAYGMGQYVLQSARVTNRYYEQLTKATSEQDGTNHVPLDDDDTPPPVKPSKPRLSDTRKPRT